MTVARPRRSASPTPEEIKLISKFKHYPTEVAIQKLQATLRWKEEQERERLHEEKKRKKIELWNLEKMSKDRRESNSRMSSRRQERRSPEPGPSNASPSRAIHRPNPRHVSWTSTASRRDQILFDSILRYRDRAGPGRRPHHRQEEYRPRRSRTETRRSESDRRGHRDRDEDYVRLRDSPSRSPDSDGSHRYRRARSGSRSPRLDQSRRRVEEHPRQLRRASPSGRRQSRQRNERSHSAIGSRNELVREASRPSSPREEFQSRENAGVAAQELNREQNQLALPIPNWMRPGEANFVYIVSPRLLEPNIAPPLPIGPAQPYPPGPWLPPHQNYHWNPYHPFPPQAQRGGYRGPGAPRVRGQGVWFPRGGRGAHGGPNY